MIHKSILILLFISTLFLGEQTKVLPDGFVYADQYIKDIDVELRYCSTYNFIGKSINGYEANILIITEPTARALQKVQEELKTQGYALKVYDGYRPQRAVNHFVRWARQIDDTLMKTEFYPKIDKNLLFKEGYIASKSGHSRGSTLDLTIIDNKTKLAIDMGSPFDFFGQESWINYQNITAQQRKNRLLLKTVMNKHGFRSYSKEWWHFTLRNEPFPDTYFDFPIE